VYRGQWEKANKTQRINLAQLRRKKVTTKDQCYLWKIKTSMESESKAKECKKDYVTEEEAI
jgi:hypothetical protein